MGSSAVARRLCFVGLSTARGVPPGTCRRLGSVLTALARSGLTRSSGGSPPFVLHGLHIGAAGAVWSRREPCLVAVASVPEAGEGSQQVAVVVVP